ENVIVVVESEELAALFRRDFDELWEKGLVEESGFVPPARVHVEGLLVRPWFTPRYGEDLSHRIARVIARARRRVRICSPVISSSSVLGTLAQVASEEKVDIAGCVQATQGAAGGWPWREYGNGLRKPPWVLRRTSASVT